MPPEQVEPGSPADWLHHAKSDLAIAKQGHIPGILLETLSFHAQQAVEKSIKAVLLAKGIVFPYTHSISALITLVKESGIPWPGELDEAAGLTEYAVETRYPGPYADVTEEEYCDAVRIAERVISWAEHEVSAQDHH